MYALIISLFNIILIFNSEQASAERRRPRRPRPPASHENSKFAVLGRPRPPPISSPGSLRPRTSSQTAGTRIVPSCGPLFLILNLLKTTFLFNCRILLILYLVEFYNHISRALRPSYVSTFKYSWMYVSGGMIMNLIGFYKIRKKPKICEVRTQTVKIRRT